MMRSWTASSSMSTRLPSTVRWGGVGTLADLVALGTRRAQIRNPGSLAQVGWVGGRVGEQVAGCRWMIMTFPPHASWCTPSGAPEPRQDHQHDPGHC